MRVFMCVWGGGGCGVHRVCVGCWGGVHRVCVGVMCVWMGGCVCGGGVWCA